MSHKTRVLCILALVACASMLVQQADAQVLYGSIVGLVEDPSGSAVPNANVTITNRGTGQSVSVTTDNVGRYLIPNVQPGVYDLKIAATGFRTLAKTDIQVSPNIVTRVDSSLEVGQITEQVTVQAEATQLQTDKADTHTTITTAQVKALPLSGYRNYQSLMNLVPGATPTRFQNSVTDTPARSLQTNVNGTNPNNNVTRIDGAASVNIWLPHHAGYVMPAEMVGEVNITTSAADAEQGFAGGSAITVVTKSGTNDLHGSAFWFHDNQHLRARNFFQAAGVQKPLSIYNNYGGTLGGPVVKNRLFYFGSFDGTRQRQGAVNTYSVPTGDIRTGNFSAYSQIIYDPATGDAQGRGRTAFPGNIIPQNRIAPQAQKIQAYLPLPNLAGQQSNYFAQAVPKFDRDYIDFKINFTRNDRHQIWGRYGRMWALVGGTGIYGEGGGPAPGSDPGLGDTTIQNASIGQTYTFSPTVLLDVTVGYQRMNQTVQGTDYGQNFGQILGIPGLNGPDERQSGFPNVDITGYNQTGVPGWMPLFRTEESYTASPNLTWSKGAHELRFGFDGVLHRLDHWQPELGAGPRGYLAFRGGITASADPGAQASNHLNAYAAFLLGLPNQLQKSIQHILMTGREWQFGWYARDRWQVSRKLTLNLGLRYEYYPLMTRAAGKGIERLDPETNKVYLGGRGSVPRNVGVTTSKTMFAPRLGIAYRATENFVIRTGYGLTYSPLPFSRPLRGFYPLTVNFDFSAPNSFVPYNTLAEGIPPVVGPDLSTGVVDLPTVASMRSPYAGQINLGYIQSWNFTVERKLPFDVVGSVAYVGTQTTHQLADLDINSGYPGSGQAGRPYAIKFNRRTSTQMWDGYLSANYHSLQTTINKQFSKGLMIKGAYTWSKAINMTDDDGWAGVNWNWGPAFYRNRAPAGYDRTHVFQIGWVYELPFGKGKQWLNSGPAAYVIGGWQINGVMAAYTGNPFTVSAPGDSLNAPSNAQTADLVGPVRKIGAVGPGTYFYDISAFKAVTDVRFGTTGRNFLRAPGLWNTDLSIFKVFPIKERAELSFRGEFFNFTNTPHFGAVTGSGMASTTVGNANFLRINTAYGERQVRFGLRLGF